MEPPPVQAPLATAEAQPVGPQPQVPAPGAEGGQEGPPYKLYVAGVPKNLTAEELQPTFDAFGEVVSCVILVEKGGTGLSRGCAFVSFAEETAAHAAIAALDNQLMLPNAPYNLRVRFAAKPQDRLAQRLSQPTSGVLTEADRRRLFFTRGPPGIQAITINQAFSPYGEIEEINLFPEREQNTTKGCGFVQYKNQDDAVRAMEALQGSMQLEGVAQKMTVSWADPERRMLKRKFQEGGYVPGTYNHPEIPPGEEREVFFAKVPRAATEQQLIDLFTTYGGAVNRVKLFTQPGAPHHKCCGLAEFKEHKGACDAILALDGIYLWPKFTDPMVVKWMDRSINRNKRPTGPDGQVMNGQGPPNGQMGYQQQPQQLQGWGQAPPQQMPAYQQQGYGQAPQQYAPPQQAQPQYAPSGYTAPSGYAPQQSQQGYGQPPQAAPPAVYSTPGQQQRSYAPPQPAVPQAYGAPEAYGAPSPYVAPQPAAQSGYAPAPQAQQPQYGVAPSQQYQQPAPQQYAAAPQQQYQVAPQQGYAAAGYAAAAPPAQYAQLAPQQATYQTPPSGGYGAAAPLFPIQQQGPPQQPPWQAAPAPAGGAPPYRG